MTLKRHLTEIERYGLSSEEIRLAEEWLRRYKTKGKIPHPEALKVYEALMLGSNPIEINAMYPEWPIGQIVLTIATYKWMYERNKDLNATTNNTIVKVGKTVIDSVIFLSTMLGVASTEHLADMQAYIADPKNNKKPKIAIESLKEYKEILDSLYKLVSSVNGKLSLLESASQPAPTVQSPNTIGKSEPQIDKPKANISKISLADLV